MKQLIARSIIKIFSVSVTLIITMAIGNMVQRSMGMEDDLVIALAIGAPIMLVCVGIVGLLFWATLNAE